MQRRIFLFFCLKILGIFNIKKHILHVISLTFFLEIFIFIFMFWVDKAQINFLTSP